MQKLLDPLHAQPNGSKQPTLRLLQRALRPLRQATGTVSIASSPKLGGRLLPTNSAAASVLTSAMK
jgi:hypothetical protein